MISDIGAAMSGLLQCTYSHDRAEITDDFSGYFGVCPVACNSLPRSALPSENIGGGHFLTEAVGNRRGVERSRPSWWKMRRTLTG